MTEDKKLTWNQEAINDINRRARQYGWRWTIYASGVLRNKVRVEQKALIGGKALDKKVLPGLVWAEEDKEKIVDLVVDVARELHRDLSLHNINDVLKKIQAGGDLRIDFAVQFAKFRKANPQASDSTWQTHYQPALRRLEEVLSAEDPLRNGADLTTAVLAHWKPGRMQTTIRQKLWSFLRWAVDRSVLPYEYRPPLEVGSGAAPDKAIGYPFADAEILELIDSLPVEFEPGRNSRHVEAAREWRFAFQLCATYGLRPEDLCWLKVKKDRSGDPELWSNYRKSMGGKRGKKTEPRLLHKLPVRNANGKPVEWNLIQRLLEGEKLPPIGEAVPEEQQNSGVAAKRMNSYLRRNAVFKRIKEEASDAGEKATAYSFRHRYARASWDKKISANEIAFAMGQTIDVHLANYARFKPSGTADSYRRAAED